LTKEGSGAITGLVYLNGNIEDPAGNPDRTRACRVARALGSIGVCTPPNNSALLGNTNTNLLPPIPNPFGGAGGVGALVSIPPL
jgi:hypothetical protein